MKFLSWIFVPVLALASEPEAAKALDFASVFEGTDILPRTINFIVFAAILFVLLFKRIKNMLTLRAQKIREELAAVENALNEKKQLIEASAEELQIAKEDAEKIIEAAKAYEAEAKEGVLKSIEKERARLDKAFLEQCRYEEKQSRDRVIACLVDQMLKKQVNFSETQLLAMIEKGAAR